jgi:hypothetical protein
MAEPANVFINCPFDEDYQRSVPGLTEGAGFTILPVCPDHATSASGSPGR